MRLGWLRPWALRFVKTPRGQAFLLEVLRSNLDLCVEVLGRHYNDAAAFDSAAYQTGTIAGFEDLMWLFTANPVNRGLARLDLDEAAYIHRLVKSLPHARCVEIGRFKGGSTFLIAASMCPASRLLSIDNHTKMNLPEMGLLFDKALTGALARFGLAERVTLAVADSATVPVEPESVDLIFFDGDHSYEGICRDFQHWQHAMKPEGHMLFHDATATRAHATVHEGVARLLQEIAHEPHFVRRGAAGSLVHLERTSVLLDVEALRR